IRSQLPLMWLAATLYHRADVRGFERIPEDRPVLFVGNHSGGNTPADSVVFMLAFNTYFGVERPVYALAHALVTSFPIVGGFGRRWGIVTADPKIGEAALARGACVLVYPGGDVETHRPWTARNEVRFDDRKGFLKPIDVEERSGDDLDAAYEYVTTLMQEKLTKLAAERRFPPFL